MRYAFKDKLETLFESLMFNGRLPVACCRMCRAHVLPEPGKLASAVLGSRIWDLLSGWHPLRVLFAFPFNLRAEYSNDNQTFSFKIIQI